MKNIICTILGLIGGAISAAFGGWDTAMVTLVTAMSIDYASGLVVAGVFKKSQKSESGALESRAGFKGLCKKGLILGIVLMCHRLDLLLGINYIKDAAIIGFVANETISIIENAGLMGVPLPAAVTKAIDILRNKAGEEDEDN